MNVPADTLYDTLRVAPEGGPYDVWLVVVVIAVIASLFVSRMKPRTNGGGQA